MVYNLFMGKKDKQLFVILHNIRSCFNVGAIFRIADAVGAEKIFLTGYTPSPETNLEKIKKTALGAEKFVNWEKTKHLSKLIDFLKKDRVKIVALETEKNALPYFKFRPKFPLAILLGNEKRGINKKILKKVDIILKIPMFGKKESLNVAVAFGIAAFDFKIKSLGYQYSNRPGKNFNQKVLPRL